MPAKTKKSRVRKRAQLSPDLALRLTIDEAVLSFDEFSVVNNLPPRTTFRVLHSHDGPIITRLSEKRRGVKVRHLKEWQQSRELKTRARA
jgi:hypothetical protein